MPPHPEAWLFRLQLLPFAKRCVPVFLDGPVPRRDQPHLIARYSRLMLVLFKPWRVAADLRGHAVTWEGAFRQFMVGCPPRYRDIMDNMQLMHECKDSRDD
ncbi:hypothetical protein CALVIDRAFT_479108, partial [Calocera viscosa TUFC12733]